MNFYGVIVPFITPFNQDGSLDLEAARWLANYQSEKGVNGIFPNSTTGEFVHLKEEEAIELVKAVMEEISGKVKVIPGISANSTSQSIELGKKMKDLGADGAVITPPYFFKLDKKRLKAHFSAVAEKVDLPIIIYNIPSTTGINIPIEVYEELAVEHSNIVGAKATIDSVSYMRNLIYRVKALRKDFSVLTGLEDHFLNTLMMGGDGGIMALANVAPQIHVSLYRAWLDKNFSEIMFHYRRLMTLAKIYDIGSSFPTAVKAAVSLVSEKVKPYARAPLGAEAEEVRQKIGAILRELEII